MNVSGKKVVIAVGKEETGRNDVLDVLRCRASVEEALKKKGLFAQTFYLERKAFKNEEKIEKDIIALAPDCVFNLFEGFSGDALLEAVFARILEKTGIPFTGNSSYALNVCLDKRHVKKLLSKHNILVPRGIFVKDIKHLYAGKLKVPLFVKPYAEDASLGIDDNSLITDEEMLVGVVKKKIKDFPSGVVVEEFIPGKEYNVGFIGSYPYELAGISVIDYSLYKKSSPFLTYRSKWDKDSFEFKKIIPRKLEENNARLVSKIIGAARDTGRILRCAGYFRVDLRQRGSRMVVLDVNPNPDINTDSGFMKQAHLSGYKYEDVIEKIVKLTGIQ